MEGGKREGLEVLAKLKAAAYAAEGLPPDEAERRARGDLVAYLAAPKLSSILAAVEECAEELESGPPSPARAAELLRKCDEALAEVEEVAAMERAYRTEVSGVADIRLLLYELRRLLEACADEGG